MANHTEPHPLADKIAKVSFKGGHPQIPGSDEEVFNVRVEDYWDRLTGKSWMFSDGNPAALIYGLRSGLNDLPLDDEVIYVKLNGFGHLVHQSELTAHPLDEVQARIEENR